MWAHTYFLLLYGRFFALRTAVLTSGEKVINSRQPAENLPVVDFHGDERDELVPLDLGQLASNHVRHLVQVSYLRTHQKGTRIVVFEACVFLKG